jgi:hypothetical protein
MLAQEEAPAQAHARLELDSDPASDVAVVACSLHQGSKGLFHHLSWACGDLVEGVAEKVVVMQPMTPLVFGVWTKDVAEATAVVVAVVAMCWEVAAMTSRRAVACWDDLVGPATAKKFHDHPGRLLVNEGGHTDHPVIQHVLAGLYWRMTLDIPGSDTEGGLGEGSDGHLEVNLCGYGLQTDKDSAYRSLAGLQQRQLRAILLSTPSKCPCAGAEENPHKLA